MNNIVPALNSRSLLVGKTGSGKTVLEKKLIDVLAVDNDVVIIDPKCGGDFDYPATEDYKVLPAIIRQNGIGVYKPPIIEDGIDHYDYVLKWIYDRSETVLVIDELYGLSQNGYTYPTWLKALYTRGRSRGITILACTQRPRGVPRFCISEVENFYVFNLGLKDDRKLLANELGESVMEQPAEYAFWYSAGRDEPTQYRVKL